MHSASIESRRSIILMNSVESKRESMRTVEREHKRGVESAATVGTILSLFSYILDFRKPVECQDLFILSQKERIQYTSGQGKPQFSSLIPTNRTVLLASHYFSTTFKFNLETLFFFFLLYFKY